MKKVITYQCINVMYFDLAWLIYNIEPHVRLEAEVESDSTIQLGPIIQKTNVSLQDKLDQEVHYTVIVFSVCEMYDKMTYHTKIT